MRPAPSDPLQPRPGRSSRGRVLLLALGCLVLFVTGSYLAGRHLLPPRLTAWVSGPSFHHLLSSAVSTALKVDGTFGPLSLGPDLAVTAEGFTSSGWPGQAIASLQTGRATGWFDPWAVLRGKWQVNLINIDHADFRLRNPDNALKAEDPVPPPKPWYAFLMPSQFFCRWIECPSMDIELPLGTATMRGTGLRIGAMMIGRNFKYFGRDGTFHYPGYADLAVDALEVYVTREIIEIGYLYLRQNTSPHSNLKLTARLGQHADKSIAASALITDLDLALLLPTSVAAILDGRLHGTLDYETDTTGKNASGHGSLAVQDGRLHNWDYLDRLAERSGQAAFRTLELDHASLDYTLADDVVRVTNLSFSGRRGVDVQGEGTWNLQTAEATADVTLARLPVGAYLPASLGGQLTGELSGHAKWSWRNTDVTHGRGGGDVSLDGGQLSNFGFQDFLDRFLKTSDYSQINITRARATWAQDENGLRLDNVDVLAPGQAGLRGSVHLAPDGTLSGTVLAGLPESSLTWLPDATTTVFARHEDGLFWCTIELAGTADKPRSDFTAQVLHQLEKHPVALTKLALRGLSWWLHDKFSDHPRG